VEIWFVVVALLGGLVAAFAFVVSASLVPMSTLER
jgi:hypothetical protein